MPVRDVFLLLKVQIVNNGKCLYFLPKELNFFLTRSFSRISSFFSFFYFCLMPSAKVRGTDGWVG